MSILKIFYMLLLCLLFLAAGLPTAEANLPIQTPTIPTPWDEGAMQPLTAAVNARRALAETLNVAEADIRITQIVEAQWSNACLGLPEPGEMCAEVITPGFLVMLQVGGQTYEFHTDYEGEAIRMAPVG